MPSGFCETAGVYNNEMHPFFDSLVNYLHQARSTFGRYTIRRYQDGDAL